MSGTNNDFSGFWGGILILVGNGEEKYYHHYLCDVIIIIFLQLCESRHCDSPIDSSLPNPQYSALYKYNQ